MDFFANQIHGFSIALSPWNLLYAFVGAVLGTAIGVLPGLGPATTIALLLAGHLHARPDIGRHPPGRGLLRGHVWGVDDVDPAEYPGRGLLGRDLPGRLPDGPERPRGSGPGHLGHRFVHRRYHRHLSDGDGGARAGEFCPEVRARRVFRPGLLRLADGGLPVGGIHPEGAPDDVDRAPAGDGGDRPRPRGGTLHLRPVAFDGRHQFHPGGHGPVRRLRTAGKPRSACRGSRHFQNIPEGDPSQQGRLAEVLGFGPARHHNRFSDRCVAGRRGHHQLVHGLCRREKIFRSSGGVRPRGHRGGGLPGGGEQRGLHLVVHPPPDAGDSRQQRDRHALRRPDDPRDPAGAALADGTSQPVLGGDRLDVCRQRDAPGSEPAADRSLGAAC